MTWSGNGRLAGGNAAQVVAGCVFRSARSPVRSSIASTPW